MNKKTVCMSEEQFPLGYPRTRRQFGERKNVSLFPPFRERSCHFVSDGLQLHLSLVSCPLFGLRIAANV